MYIVALVIFLLILFYSLSLSGSLISIIDIPSIILIGFITVSMLLASGLIKDLKRAFVIMAKRDINFTKLELQRSLEAVQLTIRLLLFSSIFELVISAIAILKLVDNQIRMGPNFSVALITVFYALFGCLIFLPIQSKLKVLILSYKEE